MKRPVVLAKTSCAILVTAIHVIVLFADPVRAEQPNFVVVLADDVSWSSFGCMNSGLSTRTPNIDRLATQGIRFENFFCAVDSPQ